MATFSKQPRPGAKASTARAKSGPIAAAKLSRALSSPRMNPGPKPLLLLALARDNCGSRRSRQNLDQVYAWEIVGDLVIIPPNLPHVAELGQDSVTVGVPIKPP